MSCTESVWFMVREQYDCVSSFFTTEVGQLLESPPPYEKKHPDFTWKELRLDVPQKYDVGFSYKQAWETSDKLTGPFSQKQKDEGIYYVVRNEDTGSLRLKLAGVGSFVKFHPWTLKAFIDRQPPDVQKQILSMHRCIRLVSLVEIDLLEPIHIDAPA